MFWKSFYEDDIQSEIKVPPPATPFRYSLKLHRNIIWRNCTQVSFQVMYL